MLVSSSFAREWLEEFNFNQGDFLVSEWLSQLVDTLLTWEVLCELGELSSQNLGEEDILPSLSQFCDRDTISALLLLLGLLLGLAGPYSISLFLLGWGIGLGFCVVVLGPFLYGEFDLSNNSVFGCSNEALFICTFVCVPLFRAPFQNLFSKFLSGKAPQANLVPLSSLPRCLKCSSCLFPPIYISDEGSLCGECQAKTDSLTVRNDALENLFSSVATTCPFAPGGCKKK